jgi:hypothetical protein
MLLLRAPARIDIWERLDRFRARSLREAPDSRESKRNDVEVNMIGGDRAPMMYELEDEIFNERDQQQGRAFDHHFFVAPERGAIPQDFASSRKPATNTSDVGGGPPVNSGRTSAA